MKKLFTLFIFFIGIVHSQVTDFSTDKVKFIDEIEKFMIIGENKELKDFFKDFKKKWEDEPTLDVYKDQIIATCNVMLDKKMRPETHFKEYLYCVFEYYNQNLPKTNFDNWQKTVDYIIKKKTLTVYLDYLKNSFNLFKYNSFQKLPGHEWSSATIDYKIALVNETSVEWQYPKSTLICIGKDDTTMIDETDAIYFPLEENIKGNGGKIYWTRNNLKKDEVFAVLKKYNINAKRSSFTADSVLFTHKKFFKDALYGSLEEKLTDVVEGRDYSYPKFDSYSKRFFLKQVFPNIDYDGGFSFYGKKFIAKGDSVNLARFTVYRDGKVFIKTASKNFSMEEDRFASQRASLTIYLEGDSIYHPGLDVKYLNDSTEFNFQRIGEGTVQTPFQDSYHDVEISAELIKWRMNTKFMTISSSRGSETNTANFKSLNFFNDLEFSRMQGMDDVHPLQQLLRFIQTKNGNNKTFTTLDYAKYLKTDVSQAKQLLLVFSIEGLVTYNVDTEIGTVTDKFYHTILSANRTVDYDVINIFSQQPRNKENALLSLLDYRLDIKGVPDVAISDSQQVEIIPYNQQLTLKKDLGISFNGRLFAGRFAFYGNNFDFDYKNFKFKLVDIDYIKIVAQTYAKNLIGENPDSTLHSIIEDLGGELTVDEMNNKAGLKDFPQYPTFITPNKAYVYYEYPKIFGSVYKKGNFYFQLDPFKKDTLDKFKTPFLTFDGTFVSDGIFPNLREKLIVMDDHSLGFFKKIDSKGLPAYGNKATFYDTLTLSNRGLRGPGRLEYLTSTAWSNDFLFFPDSMNTFAYRFGIKKTKGKTETPDVKAVNVNIHWEPDKDKFDVKETGTMFEMYEGQSRMRGKLTLTATGLEGSGRVDFGNAGLDADDFRFKSDDFHSDKSNFDITQKTQSQDADSTLEAYKVENVNADVTFVGRTATLKANDKETVSKFPQNRFKAYFDEMVWYMDKQKMDLNSQRVDEIGLKGALIVSTDPRLDSLAFIAPDVKFYVDSLVLDCKGVKYVDVADSRLFPVDERVVIRKNAEIDPFYNATVWVGKDEKIHILRAADVQIFTSHRYAGKAEYTYVDELGKAQVIQMTSVDVDEKDITIASGFVEQIADFSLSPHFGFKGSVNLYGKNKFLSFDGFVRINHTCDNMKKDWMKFQTEIDPNYIMIPVSNDPEDDEKNKLFNGFLFASDSTGIYPAIVTPRTRYSDVEVLATSGFLFFDKRTQEFKIASKEKLEDPEEPGNYISFNVNNCTSFGEGKMDLGAKLGQVDLACSGTVYHEPKADSVVFDIMMSINFKLEATLLKYFEDKFKALTTTGADIQDAELKRAITDLLDSGKADKIYQNLNSEGKFKRLPTQLKKMLVLTDLHFTWDKAHRTLLHSGDAGILVLNGEQINKSCKVLIELNRKASGDILNFYLEIDENNGFFFSYRNNVMSIFSTDKTFMDMFAALDANKRFFTVEGQPQYSLTVSSKSRLDKFKKKFGIE